MNRRDPSHPHYQGKSDERRPERYPQQEWSDDDYRFGHRYRTDRPYAEDPDRHAADQSAGYRGGDYPYGRDFSQSQGGYGADVDAQGNRSGSDYGEPASPRGGGEAGNPAAWSGRQWDEIDRAYPRYGSMGSGRRAQSEERGLGPDIGSRGRVIGMRHGDGVGKRHGQDFSGRGPKGYTRSDERLREDICERLTDDPLIDAGDISIDVLQGKVSLTGQVDERWMKHHVEDVIDRCTGVKDIDNRLSVQRLGAGPSGETARNR